MILVGITGTLGAGKGTVVEYLKNKYGFRHYSARDFIAEETEKRGLPVNRDTLIATGNALREEHGPGHIVEELLKRAGAEGGKAVIESLRATGEVAAARKIPGFRLFAVDADPKRQEMGSDDPHRQNLAACISMADKVFRNDGAPEDLYAQVDSAMNGAGA
jgi:dephospho-CoA kinase